MPVARVGRRAWRMIRRGRELSWESGSDGRRGQHQDPALAFAVDRVAANLVAVHLGQVAVQHDHVVAGDAGAVKGLLGAGQRSPS